MWLIAKTTKWRSALDAFWLGMKKRRIETSDKFLEIGSFYSWKNKKVFFFKTSCSFQHGQIMGLLETGNLSFIRNEAGYVFLRQEKKIHRQAKHTKQLFNQEANSLGWFLFTCWLEIPFFSSLSKETCGDLPEFLT